MAVHKYTLHEAASGVYMITDGNYQNMFVTTSDGVVVVDAPSPLLNLIEPAIREVTDDPVSTLVYTHMHKDHIGAAGKIATGKLATPDLDIYAGGGTAAYLQAKQDPSRPVPTHVFSDKTTLTRGGRTFELEPHLYHCVSGDVLISMPQEKVVMAVDLMAPDWVPIFDFDIAVDIFGYMNAFDYILSLDFDTLIGGHAERLSKREDVQKTSDYVQDVYRTVKRMRSELDISGLYAEDRGNEQRLAKELFSGLWVGASKEIAKRWKDGPMQGVELWTESHCRAMFMYVHFSD
jgi:glyoxylase-like metal-dependent hydrolase (beta-lactamase superfamily II)